MAFEQLLITFKDRKSYRLIDTHTRSHVKENSVIESSCVVLYLGSKVEVYHGDHIKLKDVANLASVKFEVSKLRHTQCANFFILSSPQTNKKQLVDLI